MNDKKTSNGEAELARELAQILHETGLTEIEIQRGDMKLRLARMVTTSHAVLAPAHAPPPPVALPAPAASPAATAASASAEARNHPGAVTSPMVGTAYLAAEPGAPVFVKIGDTVTEGQTLMVVEAMKTFNPIPAPRAGKVSAILVTDAQPVEFGEALVVLD